VAAAARRLDAAAAAAAASAPRRTAVPASRDRGAQEKMMTFDGRVDGAVQAAEAVTARAQAAVVRRQLAATTPATAHRCQRTRVALTFCVFYICFIHTVICLLGLAS